MFRTLVVCGCLAAALAAPQGFQNQQFQNQAAPRFQNNQQFQQRLPQATTTPVPILRQISQSNDDGSYTYGYEAADGSFKLETRKANGEVFGKYGYVDANGELRTVEYGASKLGFNPSGKGITVAPPTLVDNSNRDYDYDYVDEVQPAPAPAAPAAPAPVVARARSDPPKPVTDTQFQSRFADFDARIKALFSSS